MTRTEILEEIKIILIGLGSFFRAYIIPSLVVIYVTGEFIIKSVQDSSKAKNNWSSFWQFWQEQSKGWFTTE